MGRVILTRIYHKLFLTRQYSKASELADYLKMLALEGIVEIDAKGNKTKAVGLVRALSHGVSLRATSLILAGITKSLLAEPATGQVLYSRQKQLRQEALAEFTNAMQLIMSSSESALHENTCLLLLEATLLTVKTKLQLGRTWEA